MAVYQPKKTRLIFFHNQIVRMFKKIKSQLLKVLLQRYNKTFTYLFFTFHNDSWNRIANFDLGTKNYC